MERIPGSSGNCWLFRRGDFLNGQGAALQSALDRDFLDSELGEVRFVSFQGVHISRITEVMELTTKNEHSSQSVLAGSQPSLSRLLMSKPFSYQGLCCSQTALL